MFTFAADCRLYQRLGLALWLAVLNLYAFGLPPFQVGIWLQMESTQIALYTLSALSALWLAVGVQKKWLMAITPHPFFLVLLAWILWQLVVNIHAGFPWRSWFGPGENNDGSALYLCGFVLFMHAFPLWQKPHYRDLIIKVGMAGILLLCMLYWFNPESENEMQFPLWRPLKYPDYLAFMAGALWICVLTIKSPKQHPAWLCGMVAFTFMVLFTSQNMSAILLMGGTMLFMVMQEGLQRFTPVRRFLYPSKTWKTLCCIACVLPFSYIVIAEQVPVFKNTVDRKSIEGEMYDSESSVGSRLVHLQIGVNTLRHEPERVLIGPGWGRFSDDMFKYALVKDAGAFVDGVRNPYTFWLIFGNAFHSHSQPLEALLSLGLIGMLLWYALPIAAIIRLPRYAFWGVCPMVIALVALSHLWFLLPQNLPYQVLMWVALCHIGLTRRTALSARPGMQISGLLLVCIVLAATAILQCNVTHFGHVLARSMLTTPFQDYPEKMLVADNKRGGERIYMSSDFLVQYLRAKADEGTMSDNDVGWFNLFLHASYQAMQAPDTTARMIALNILLFNNLYFDLDGTRASALQEENKSHFKQAVLRLAEIAPGREDFASTYLHELSRFSDGTPDYEIHVLQEILQVEPTHRSALWLLGQRYAAGKDKALQEEGRAMMQRAIDLGAPLVYPITNEEQAPFKNKK
jgi:hypothetical protein